MFFRGRTPEASIWRRFRTSADGFTFIQDNDYYAAHVVANAERVVDLFYTFCEQLSPAVDIVIEDLRIPAANVLGERGQGHRLGQYRLGPARLAHCMRWIAQAETALDMMVDRSLNRFAHGSLLAEKQGIQWMIADSSMELYQAKLMVLHAAYRIDNGLDFTSEVSMAKHFVANMLNRVIDRSIQVHGALGYSTDTPLAHMYQHARWARFADGADEVHQMRIAQRTIAAYRDNGSTRVATGDLPI